MTTQLELLIALLSLLAGVIYAWLAVQGWRPWRLLPVCTLPARRRMRHRGDDRVDAAPGVKPHAKARENNQAAP